MFATGPPEATSRAFAEPSRWPPVYRARTRAASRLRRDLWADDRDLGDRLQRPLRRLDPGRLGGDASPVALEARGRTDQQVARGRVAVIGQRVGYVARGEDELARALGHERLLDLEDQLALEQVEGLVEVVRVQRGAGAVRRDHDLDHGHVATGLLAAQQDVGAEVQHGWHRFELLSGSGFEDH